MQTATVKNYTNGTYSAGTKSTYTDGTDGTRVETDTKTDANLDGVFNEAAIKTADLVDSSNPTGYAQVLEEWNVTSTPAISKSYVIGSDVIAQAQGSDVYYLLYDGHGSVRLLVDNSITPVVVETYNYDAYGNLINFTGTPISTLLYTGEQRDARTGLYYLRARYYDAATGRFTTTDPARGNTSDPISLHKYLYCGLDPVNMIDPNGMEFSLCELGITISVISTLSLNVLTSITAVGNMALSNYKIDGWYFSVRGNYSAIGGTIGGGFDIIYENRNSTWWVALTGEFGTSPVSVFVPQRGFGMNVMAGPIFGMSNPQDMSGAGVQAVWPASILHLLPGTLFSSNKAWGAMTQLAKRSKNVNVSDAAFALGVSTSGPSFFQVGLRSNSFSSVYSQASQYYRVSDVSMSLATAVRNVTDKVSPILYNSLDFLVENADRFVDILEMLNI